MNNAQPIMEILDSAQDGNLILVFASAAGVQEASARTALDTLTSDIARRIADLVKNSDRYDDLMDVLDEEERDQYLDKPGAILDRGAIEDGEDILKSAYGSLDVARSAARRIGAPDGIESDVFERIMTLAATLTLAAMARRNRIYQFGVAGGTGTEPEQRGFIATMISALITGFLEGFRQATRRKRRRRKRSAFDAVFGSKRSTRRTKRTRKRRQKTPSLNDLLGDLLKG